MKSFLVGILIFCMSQVSFAGEGMWLPMLLKSLNEAEMQQMGMKLTAEDIYSVNKGSLKDAIVHFGGFCTSELISPNGLLLTNHHCGYGQIQSHSSLENNYLKNGFWAKSHQDELPNEGLTATFISEIIDVTSEVLDGVSEGLSVSERQSVIDKNINKVVEGMEKKAYQDVYVRPFFHGNQFFAFKTITYRDVRLVGAPPESIGKFGADTDNWVWPRHTGDFSLFRIYAGPDNLPADYSPDNKPYKPKHYLPISLDGVEEGDFTMVFGFPGRTQEYLPSPAIEQIVNTLNPAKIGIREKALGILDKYMRTDEETRIKYASKFARVANYWKKWIGESKGLKRTKGIAKKQAFEKSFMDALPPNSKYKNILPTFEKLYAEMEPLAYVRDYYSEVTGRNIEVMRVISIAQRLVDTYDNNGEDGYNAFKQRVIPFLDNFYKNYDANIDAEVFEALTEMYVENVDSKYVPKSLMGLVDEDTKLDNGRSPDLFSKTVMADRTRMMAVLEMTPDAAIRSLKRDPAYRFGKEWKELFDSEVAAPLSTIQFQIDSLQRVYMDAQMKTFPNRTFYPDANSTMRVTYGKVAGYEPVDAVLYQPVTYLDGVIEKYKPGDYEFDVDDKLLELYETKNYGQYADTNGKVPVCFIGTNHTTGGNSGSPAIDAHGNLIGLNFDRAWEGTMSDYNYDASICRNIMVDIRYVLFIVDKYAGAGHLIDEMTLLHPKK
ncbi:MAG: S46 family peptidase [Saprospiraceae bacterium]|nr:S46 family peptidase [Bacteroidia bacterium]NNL92829.1 S46 family peptidase [Saprospiraceae bacterium]